MLAESGFFFQNAIDPGTPRLYFVAALITVVVSIVLHELAHGWAAIWQGDDTPRTEGHMTPDPLVHMGGMSLLAFFLVGIAWGMMPVNPNRFRSKYGDALVSAAGPAMNLLLSFVSLTTYGYWISKSGFIEQGSYHNLQQFLWWFGSINLVLMIFNLAPVPPLDGSRILGNFSPPFKRWMDSFEHPNVLFIIWFIVIMASGLMEKAQQVALFYVRFWDPNVILVKF